MKTCTKCNSEKRKTEFYKDTRYNLQGLASHCKACVLQRQKSKVTKKYPVQIDGTKKCKACKNDKTITDFRINRVRKTGRETLCKPCHSLQLMKWRRKKQKVYFNTEYTHLKANYHTAICEICNSQFNMNCYNQRRCGNCFSLARKIYSSLTSARNGIKAGPCPPDHVINITKRFWTASKCCYCKQDFSKDNPKNLDHITPFVKGGSHNPNNINICCYRCNMSKRDLELKAWVNLCKRVALYN